MSRYRVVKITIVFTALVLCLASATAVSAQEAADTTDTDRVEAFSSWLQEAMPDALREGELLGLQYWQWIGLLLLIFLGVVLDFLARATLRPVLQRGVERLGGEVEKRSIDDTVRGFGLFAGAIVWLLLIRALSFGGTVREVAAAAVGVYAVFTGTLFGWRFTDLAGDVLMSMARRTRTKYDDILVPLLRKTAKVFIVALGVIYGAQHLNINIVPLVTGLGIGGLAFAFAAKDTIENFFGSVAVILDRPFEVGDWVVVEGVEGTVEEMGLRSTRIRTFYNSQVTVPNASLVRANVDNYGRRTFRRWKTYIGVQYDTSPERLQAFTEGIRELVRRHPYTRKDYYHVWCNDFGESSLNILLYVFFKVPDWATELRERERLFIDIVRLADNLGVQFAFPTRTVHLYREEHGAAAIQYDLPGASDDEDARVAGIRTARDITRNQPWRSEPPPAVSFDDFQARSRDLGGDE